MNPGTMVRGSYECTCDRFNNVDMNFEVSSKQYCTFYKLLYSSTENLQRNSGYLHYVQLYLGPGTRVSPVSSCVSCQGKVILYVEIQRSSSEGFVELLVNQILVSKKAIHGSTL